MFRSKTRRWITTHAIEPWINERVHQVGWLLRGTIGKNNYTIFAPFTKRKKALKYCEETIELLEKE